MFLSDIVRRSGRSLRSAKGRTILTAMAIAVGGFTLTLTLAASNGARDYADKIIEANFDPAELIVARDSQIFQDGPGSQEPQEYDPSIGSTSFGGGQQIQFKRVTEDDVKKLRSDPDIERVRKTYSISLTYITREGQKKYVGSAEAYNPGQKPEMAAGTNTEEPEEGRVYLPEAYLGPLGFSSAEDAIGKQVTVVVQKAFKNPAAAVPPATPADPADPNAAAAAAAAEAEFETKTLELLVAGVTRVGATELTFSVPNILLSTSDAEVLSNFAREGTPDYQKYMVVYARVKDGHNDSKRLSVQRKLESDGFTVQSVEDTQKQVTQIITVLQGIVTGFGVITLIASVFGIVNTQYISVLERTREIGLMKALGMRKRDVNLLFMLEATWIGFLGGLIGSLLGLAAGYGLNPWIAEKLELGEGNYLLVFNPLQIVALIVALMLIATIAGLLPARKAAKLDPIEALRTE